MKIICFPMFLFFLRALCMHRTYQSCVGLGFLSCGGWLTYVKPNKTYMIWTFLSRIHFLEYIIRRDQLLVLREKERKVRKKEEEIEECEWVIFIQEIDLCDLWSVKLKLGQLVHHLYIFHSGWWDCWLELFVSFYSFLTKIDKK